MLCRKDNFPGLLRLWHATDTLASQKGYKVKLRKFRWITNWCSQNTNKYKLFPFHHGSSHYTNMSLELSKKPWFTQLLPLCSMDQGSMDSEIKLHSCHWNLLQIPFSFWVPVVTPLQCFFPEDWETQEWELQLQLCQILSAPTENIIKVCKKNCLLKFSKGQEWCLYMYFFNFRRLGLKHHLAFVRMNYSVKLYICIGVFYPSNIVQEALDI